jgi:PLP dependent protein
LTDQDVAAIAELASQIDKNHQAIAERIRIAGGNNVTIVAVSKGQTVASIRAAAESGFRLFGENYADELVGKANDPLLADMGLDWTFQGRLQTNKINRLVPHVGLWQTVDTLDRASALAKRAPGANVLVQLNLTEAPERTGVTIADAGELIVAARSLGLNVAGIMGVGPDPEDPLTVPGASERAFHDAVLLANEYALEIKSLGMSTDFEDAIRAGSTMIRLGSLLFGARTIAPEAVTEVAPEIEPHAEPHAEP